MARKIFKLTSGAEASFAWGLPKEIARYKVTKMPAQQWANVIKGFSQKGIKAAEIGDSKVLEWLEEQGKTQLTREEVAEYVSYALPSIKEARLTGTDVRYRPHCWASPGEDYNESLFYFPTVAEDIEDRIADLDDAIAQLNFDFDALGRDPDIIFRLDKKRQKLLAESNDTTSQHLGTHFSALLQSICPDARADFAHMRWSVLQRNGKRVLMVHEFQSDWAQRGRAYEWRGAYKRAPLVTETEHWTAFLLKRAMLLAVENDCEQMTWINGAAMANGGGGGSQGLDEFYMKIVPGLAKKLAKPFKSELVLDDMELKGMTKRLAVMPITEEMREGLRIHTPVYSHASLVADATFDPVQAARLQKSLQMRACETFGREHAMRVSVVREIFDAFDGSRAAGSLVSKLAQVAFNAADPVAALDHEGFHFAYQYHFSSKERAEIDRQFSSGSPMLVRTVRLLMTNGMYAAAQQAISSPEEAAAHAYSFWRKGQMSLARLDSVAAPGQQKGIRRLLNHFFPVVQELVGNVCSWIRGTSVSPSDFVTKVVRAGQEARDAAAKQMSTRSATDEPDEQVTAPVLTT